MSYLFKKDISLTSEKTRSLEWIDTNGLGGYSSSTLLNCHTRKYHGLLVASEPEFSDKQVLLSKLEDVLSVGNSDHFLSASQYPGVFQDESFSFFKEFLLDTHPVFVYQFGKTLLTKEILMIEGENTVLIKYKIVNGKDSKLKLRPLIAARSFHALAKENANIQTQMADCKNGKKFIPYQNYPCFYFQTNSSHKFSFEPLWYRNFEYEEEKNRGFDFQEDLFSPGVFSFSVDKENTIIFSCSDHELINNLSDLWASELNRRAVEKNDDSLQGQLKKVSHSFFIKNPKDNLLSIIAGYHWFLEWGRDAMISLPGLTLFSGHEKECLEILKKFSGQELKGLIPNFLGETADKNAYNSVDASLWFVWAVQQYFMKTKDLVSIKQYFWSVLKNIFFCYKNGTLYDIHMNEDGLIVSGSEKTNLSWMDAMVDGFPATPRYGALVEINALWFNMLCFMEQMAKKLKDDLCFEIKQLIEKLVVTYPRVFWNEKLNCLYDFVLNGKANSAIRPNQIFAVSLPFSPIKKGRAEDIIRVVEEHLLTSYGLRTLSLLDSDYVGYYDGNSRQRDQAYHNGTVWPWLLGHFGEASLKIFGRRKTLEAISPCLNAFKQHLFEAGIGSISEIFDGDFPHKPNGCISQAWSVAEILRLTHLLKWSS